MCNLLSRRSNINGVNSIIQLWDNLYNLNNKVALITGANHGIGAATAKALAAEGSKVFINYYRMSPEDYGIEYEDAKKASETGMPLYHFFRTKDAQEVVDSIENQHGIADSWEADLRDTKNIPLLLDKVESKYGSADILVNNAAEYRNNDAIDTITEETIDETYSVNVKATLLLIAEFVKRYKKNGMKWGRIINLSTGPSQCFVKQIAYGSSKAAIEAFTRSIAVEVGPIGITINTVAPGATQTGYISAEDEKELIPSIPLRRLGKPEDIANAILFLISDKASWITGQVLRVNGGRDLY
jgi:3-oxoacyl-[acyl-carrier protein] reductase